MALEIKRKETVRHALRRIGRRLAGKARAALRDDTLEAIHEARKDIKQSRALLRLFQSGLSRRTCRCFTKTLKKIASALAPSRDAFIKTSALNELASHFKHGLPPRAFEGISRVLARDCRKKQQEFAGDLKRSRRLLKKIRRDFCSMDTARSGWKVIGPGIRRSYRAGRRDCQLARATDAAEDFHEWRKGAKDLLYQVRFLCGIWPEQMKALEAELDQLGDCLGDAHDLSVLAGRETIKQLAGQPGKEIETLKALARRRQKELHAKALKMGARIYMEKPASFCERFERCWRCWRRKAQPVPVSQTRNQFRRG